MGVIESEEVVDLRPKYTPSSTKRRHIYKKCYVPDDMRT